MTQRRFNHAMVMLPSGLVLACGGSAAYASRQMPMHMVLLDAPDPRERPLCLCGQPCATAELYDPGTDSWCEAASMSSARTGARAAVVFDSTLDPPRAVVLVMGGVGTALTSSEQPTYLSSVEAFDPLTGQWLPRPSMQNRRADFGVVVLPSGQVLVAGGTGFAGSTSPDDSSLENEPWSALPVEEASRLPFLGGVYI